MDGMGQRTTNFYERLTSERNDSAQLKHCIRSSVDKLKTVGTQFNRPGMLLGKIQSGKTRAFLGIMALAFDEGFDVAIVLTKGTRTLAQQTVQRISDDFKAFRDEGALEVYDIMSVPDLSPWEVEENKIIIVVKKEYRNLERLKTLITETQPLLQNRRTLIIDDEADFASVRFAKVRGKEEIEQGRIADQLDDLRRSIQSSAFLQVTATPYSLYLQPEDYDPKPGDNFSFEPKRPAFTELVPIHQYYVGGDHYFGEHGPEDLEYYLWYPVDETELAALKKEDRRRVKTDEILTTSKIEALRHGVITFVVGAIIRRLQQGAASKRPRKYSMIVHVETARASHAWQELVVGEIVNGVKQAIADSDPIVEELISEALADLAQSIATTELTIPPRAEIVREFHRAFTRGGIVCEKVNSDNDVMALLDESAELKLRTPYNIFIGGQILDRGITVPNLIGFFYGRSPKKMQQDTVLQHSRMYGARPRNDLAVTRFYTTLSNHSALKNIHEFDSALRHAFETGAHDRGVAFVQRDHSRVIPCAPNKLLMSSVKALRPGSRWLPVGFEVKAKTHIAKLIAELDSLIASTDSEDSPSQIDIRVAIDIVTKISKTLTFDRSAMDFDWRGLKAALEYYANIVAPESQAGSVWVLSARERSIARVREGGRFSNAPDTKQQRDALLRVADNLPALVLLRQQGQKQDGWSGYPFWWPVFIAPMNSRTSVFAQSGD